LFKFFEEKYLKKDIYESIKFKSPFKSMHVKEEINDNDNIKSYVNNDNYRK
jgi:hypothetical protein